MTSAVPTAQEEAPPTGGASSRRPLHHPGADSTDGVRAYMGAIGRHALLSAQQEVELGRAVQEGRRAAAELDGAEVDSGRRRTLQRQVRNGEAARREFIEANLRLVVSVAKRYQNRGLEMADLIQEGNLGLIQAVERFDWARGYRFSTYATWWIRKTIGEAIEGLAAPVRIPKATRSSVRRVSAADDGAEFSARTGLTELADRRGIDVAVLAQLVDGRFGSVSLSSPTLDGDAQLEDLVPDPEPDPAAVVAERAVAGELRRQVGLIDPLEQEVLNLRYGLRGASPLTVRETSRALRLSAERTRQVETHALAELRRHRCGFDDAA